MSQWKYAKTKILQRFSVVWHISVVNVVVKCFKTFREMTVDDDFLEDMYFLWSINLSFFSSYVLDKGDEAISVFGFPFFALQTDLIL